MKRPRVLDLFCGAGGASMGWYLAGCDVVGVDIRPQPLYPLEFHRADAMDWPLDGFDIIHAPPPCQRYARVTRWIGSPDGHPDLLGPVLEWLRGQHRPWVVENVPEAIPKPDLMLCGSMFGLEIRRHRHFLSSVPLSRPDDPCRHVDLLPFMHKDERTYADAMDCGWMGKLEAREAIPPAYTRWIGAQVLASMGLDPPARRPRASLRVFCCVQCGAEFTARKSHARYCTNTCRKAASRSQIRGN